MPRRGRWLISNGVRTINDISYPSTPSSLPHSLSPSLKSPGNSSTHARISFLVVLSKVSQYTSTHTHSTSSPPSSLKLKHQSNPSSPHSAYRISTFPCEAKYPARLLYPSSVKYTFSSAEKCFSSPKMAGQSIASVPDARLGEVFRSQVMSQSLRSVTLWWERKFLTGETCVSQKVVSCSSKLRSELLCGCQVR